MSKQSRNARRIELTLYAELDRLYAAVPEVKCKGLCQRFCTTIMVGPAEGYRLNQAAGTRIDYNHEALRVLHGLAKSQPCPHLTTDGRCGVYAVRPLVCRVFGAADDLSCPYGCEIVGQPLTPSKGSELIAKVNSIALPVELDPSQLASPMRVTKAPNGTRLMRTADLLQSNDSEPLS